MKGPNDPPHLLVIEHIDPLCIDGCEFYLHCPYDIHEVRVVSEWIQRPFGGGSKEVQAAGSSYWVHTDEHYCTISAPRAEVRPLLTMQSVWEFDGLQHCGQITINDRVLSRGGCVYQEVAAEDGVLEMLTGRYVNRHDPWPDDPALPQRPGEYPIYYWSNHGYFRDDFTNGFTLDPFEATGLSGVG